jgi:formylglycine-generating enzyme required for sulfatase activity
VLKGSSSGNAQATRENIEKKVRRVTAPLGKDDMMLVMLSGHGQQLVVVQPDGRRKDEAFYCPVDAVAGDATTLFSLSHLTDDILAPNVGRKMLLVDACRDTPSDPARGARGIQGRVISLPEDTAVFFSCRSGQESFERDELKHGLFTYCILDGLRDKAAQDNEIEWSGLVSHVNRRMRQPDMTRLMPADRPQVPIPAGGVPYTVLARIAPARIENPLPKPEKPRMARTENRPRDEGVPSAKTLSNSIGMKLALIPAGEFQMGAADGEEKAQNEEKPKHRMRITKPFYLGTYEVTQGEFERVIGRNPSYFSTRGGGKANVSGQDTDRFPVESVSWYDAVEFCNKLSESENRPPYYRMTTVGRYYADGSIKAADVAVAGGNGYRLPTEAEWEYACRAGTTTPFHFGTALNGNEANSDGNFPYGTTEKGAHLERTTTVGSFNRPNAFGLHDMHGNVWEWCWDRYGEDYYRKSPESDPAGPSLGSFRVLRGGGWYAKADYCRAAHRFWGTPVYESFDMGFRLARSSGE